MLAQLGFELFRELGACAAHLEQMPCQRTNDEVRLIRTSHDHRLLTERIANLIGDLLPQPRRESTGTLIQDLPCNGCKPFGAAELGE